MTFQGSSEQRILPTEVINAFLQNVPATVVQEAEKGVRQVPCSVSLFQSGRCVVTSVSATLSNGGTLRHALLSAAEALPRGVEPATYIVSLPYSVRPFAATRNAPLLANARRGITGLMATYRGQVALLYPWQSIATNRPLAAAYERLLQQLAEEHAALDVNAVETHAFFSHEYIRLPDASLAPLYRGSHLVRLEDLTSSFVSDMLDRCTQWFLSQIRDTGELPYKYWPSLGEYASSNNALRQFMATLCLAKLAAYTDRDDLRAVARRNADFNLQRYYRHEDNLGLIDDRGAIKLGAIALAALALHCCWPESDRPEVRALLRTTDYLWTTSGRFRTFLKPAERADDNQNFYSGEALLLWAHMASTGIDEQRWEKFMTSARHYCAWHRAHRNPAFVPWHTMAYAQAYRHRPSDELLALVFEMNDWLLPMQQINNAPCPDMRGRFYRPDQPSFGPPHASSTGVYVEGLCAALKLAIHVGDDQRTQRYSNAIRYGLRSLRQLQFHGDVDQFYIRHRERTAGGLRTTVYDNAIRLDNVQHCAMALMSALPLLEHICDSSTKP